MSTYMPYSITNDIVLTKATKLGKTFLKVISTNQKTVTLQDIKNKVDFIFDSNHLETLIENGSLLVAQPDELESILKSTQEAILPIEQQINKERIRRLNYVKGALESSVKYGSQPKLAAYVSIRSLELVDTKPPSAVSVYRWINTYLKSGQDELSLNPKLNNRGNRSAKVCPAQDQLIDAFLIACNKNMKMMTLYREYLERLKCENDIRESNHQEKIIAISSEGFRKRLDNILKTKE